MADEKRSFLEQAAVLTRYLVVAVIAVIVFGAATSVQRSGNQVFASGTVSSLPGHLTLTLKPGTNNKFYLVDTYRKIILVYFLSGEKLRLVSARPFEQDSKILDSTIKAPIAIDGGYGATATEAEQYAKNSNAIIENEKKKFK